MNSVDKLVKKYIETIREQWFKNHQAKVIIMDDITVIDWSNGNHWLGKMRMILDRNFVFISGDYGVAVYQLTCDKATIDEIASYDLCYFNEKLSVFSHDKNDFETDIAREHIFDWYQEMLEFSYNPDDIDNIYASLEDILDGCVTSIADWQEELKIIQDDIESVEENIYGSDLWEAGQITDIRLYAFLEAFKMIKEQMDKLKSA